MACKEGLPPGTLVCVLKRAKWVAGDDYHLEQDGRLWIVQEPYVKEDRGYYCRSLATGVEYIWYLSQLRATK